MKQNASQLIQGKIIPAGKKLFMAAVIAVAFTTAAFANVSPDVKNVNEKALDYLNYQFKNATNIAWKVTPDFIRGAFTWNGQSMEIFYDNDGDLIGTSKAITKDVLPRNAQKFIGREYAGYSVTEAIEFTNAEGETSHFASVENNTRKIVLQVDENGSVSVYKTIPR